jgi:hypothetical protein
MVSRCELQKSQPFGCFKSEAVAALKGQSRFVTHIITTVSFLFQLSAFHNRFLRDPAQGKLATK